MVCVVTEATPHTARPTARPDEPARPLHGVAGAAVGDLVLAGPTAHGWAAVGPPLAQAGSFRAGLVNLAVGMGVDPTYPPAVMEEARRRAAAVATGDPELVDLRALPWVTIDNLDSRDLDQALCVERDGNGYTVWYALADAAFYVRPGGSLFSEALERGASYYLPGFAVPMLPPVLSEGVISLNPGVDRRAMVFEVRLDARAEVRHTRIVRALVHSRRKLSYQRVQRSWDEPAGSGFRGEPFAGSLELLREVGRLRIAEANRRHAVSYHRHEVEIDVGGEIVAFRVLARERLEVERCNEQISLLVNVEGARMLRALKGAEHVQPIFRVHPAPSPERLARFAAQVEEIVRRRRLDRATWEWRCDDGEPLADYMERLPRSGSRTGLAQAIERQALLTNERSEFNSQPAPHYGVAAPVYARFSSPMREIVGIFTHKEMLEALGAEPAAANAADVELRDRVVEAGNRAKDLQRRLELEADRLVLDRLFGPETGRPLAARKILRGTVLGLRPRRLYVRLDDPPVETKVDVAPLERALGSPLAVDPLELEIGPRDGGEPRVGLGDQVRLRVARRNPDRGRWEFDLVIP